ncbi:Woronin body major protein [Penicillium rolfsii]|nr:Woronin body major protein [Penicillium rolfsii]
MWTFERHSRKDAVQSVNLDFDARVPIPFSVFPSSYRSDAVSETTQTRVEGEVQLDTTSRVEREDTRASAPLPDPRVYGKEEVDLRITQEDRNASVQHTGANYAPRYESHETRNYAAEVDLTRERYPNYRERTVRFEERPQVYDQTVENQLDITEREYRRRTAPTYEVDVTYDRRYQEPTTSYDYQPTQSVDVSYDRSYQPQPASAYRGPEYSRREVELQKPSTSTTYVPVAPKVDVKVQTTTVRNVTPASRKMGYYDDEGHYHSFRRGVERAAERVLHPFHHHEREEVIVSDERGPARFSEGVREEVRIVEPRNRGTPGETVPIPCHFVRVGDILILQGRPCQVIRISVSPQTGQHRYLGVDLFTRQLQEESSFVSNPSPSVVVQTMLGPVYKTYRILDLRDDGKLVAMTETGDVKQGLPVITQGNLFKRIGDAFADGRGSVRALVINDGGRELVVDFKVIHGSRL